ncbi:hypothetical protein EOE67_13890 [Rheinheimera riviphila]|uniref:Haemolysin-type calcium binding-related domain-containing protein n=1 Tax=Rheinheimera riviphila TaxID=1834037 RepID=A0A437QLS9_9GAMM|nr:calcium-binding protein [Rheinheimera riviphila]RVU35463.1 hypothetical protein EOE67_13890 [Rheinheimera riviphila]
MSDYKAVIHVDSGSHENKAGYHVWIVLFDANGRKHQYSYGPAENPFNGPGAFRDLPEAEGRSDYKINIDITKDMFDSMKSKADALKASPPPYFLVDAPNLAHSILGSNCATVVSDILKAGGINKFENYFTPTQYQAHIESIQAMKSVFDKFTSLSDNLSGYVGDILDRINDLSGFFDNIDSSILDGLLNLSNGLRKIQSFFGANPTGYLPNDINSLFNMIDRAVNAPRDPLVLDLDGDGVETVGTNAGIMFDHNGDGLKHGTGWVKPDDGLLVVDWNENGVIDSGKELFGDNTIVDVSYNGVERKAKDGFEALKAFDGNDANGQPWKGDGVIDAKDKIFSRLKVWQDLNQDGVTQQGELKTLAELGISSINLDNKNKGTTQHGNRVDSVSSFQFSDGREHEMSSLFFAADTFRNSFNDKIPLTERTEKLPDFAGSGGLRSLREAATLDDNLASLLETFSKATTRSEQLALVDDILWQWHLGSELETFHDKMAKIAYRSYFDPYNTVSMFPLGKEYLTGRYSVIEAFNGRPIENIVYSEYRGGGGGAGSVARSNTSYFFFPSMGAHSNFPFQVRAQNAERSIESTYQEIFNQVFSSLSFKTRLADIIDSVELNFDEAGISLNFEHLEGKLTAEISKNKLDGLADLFDIVKYYKEFVQDGSWDFISFCNTLTSSGLVDDESIWESKLGSYIQKATEESTDINGISSDWEVLLGDSRNNIINGDNGDELIIAGRGNDVIEGHFGNNTMDGGVGDDILKISSRTNNTRDFSNTFIGGTGNDRMEGALGADTYVYNLGDGNDVILDKSSHDTVDKLVFGEGITGANITLQRSGNHLVVLITHPQTGEVSTITIEDAVTNNLRRLEQMVFADGTVIDGDWLEKFNLVGTKESDEILGTNASETIYGLAGNDIIEGEFGNNTLIGGEGNDTLKIASLATNTRAFSNTFIGGTGNDRMEGALGADTYLYNLGDGNDVILDKSSHDTVDKLVFGEGITAANINLQRSGNHLVVLVAHPQTGEVSTITIEDAVSNALRRLEQMVFADGTVIEGDWFSELSYSTHGTEGNDTITGDEKSDVIYGLAGNDIIEGGFGNNTMDGGEGDDILRIASVANNTRDFSNTFIGGTGNDRMEGASGADTYVYNLGDGNDVIADKAGGTNKADTLSFGAGITAANISLQRNGNHLVVLVAHPQTGEVSTITIEDAVTNSLRRIEQMVFADGSVIEGDWFSQLSYATYGTEGNDTITGDEKSDVIYGLAGNDVIDGGFGNNTLNGGEGNDTLKIAPTANNTKDFRNTFIGGSGNDRMEGAHGADTYVYNLGDGNDVIVDNSSYNTVDRLVFGEGITAANISLQRNGNHLVVLVTHPQTGEVSTITIEDAVTIALRRIEQMVFADGSVIEGDWLEKLALTGTTGDDNIAGTNAHETIYGLAGHDIIDGGFGNNKLHGGEGNDTLRVASTATAAKDFSNTFIGGTGNDRLEGAHGADTYLYNLGDGNDVIVDKSSYTTVDKLVFGAGITAANISLQCSGNNLVVLVAHPQTGEVSTITIEDAVTHTTRRIEQMVFADGTMIEGDWLEKLGLTGTYDNDNIVGTNASETIYGLAGNDVIDGGFGNNTLNGGVGSDTLKIASTATNSKDFRNTFIGGAGNDRLEGAHSADTYIYNLGDGNDVIVDKSSYTTVDKLVFGVGITAANISLQRNGNHLVVLVTHPQTGEVSTITIEDAMTNTLRRLEQMVFADGTVIEGDWLEKLALTGTTGDDNITGTNASETIYGMAGNDTIDGGFGNNILNGGEGDDTLKIASTATNSKDFRNTFIGGTGNDRMEGAHGADTYVYNLGDGNDVIVDKSSYTTVDKLVFGAGITAANISLQRAGNHLVVMVAHPQTGEISTITIEDAATNTLRRIEQMVFADGTVINGDWHSQLSSTSIGTNNNDVITGGDKADWLFGMEGNDTLSGGLGHNRLVGGAGDDTLKIVSTPELAKDFHNILIGGIGNDRLEGSFGLETYMFNLGDGQDTIRDLGGIDKLVFGSGITQSHLQLQRTADNHLVIRFLNNSGELTGDQITIENAFTDSGYAIESLEFADGSIAPIDLSPLPDEPGSEQFWKDATSEKYLIDIYGVDAKVANLIDALNAFDTDTDTEVDVAISSRLMIEEYAL